MKWKDIESVSALRRGDQIISKALGERLTVVFTSEALVVAARIVVLTDQGEGAGDWQVRRPNHEAVSWAEGEKR